MKTIIIKALILCGLLITLNQVALAQSTVNYGFTKITTASLTDMSVGSTQLVAASSNNVTSINATIGFDFWFMGTYYTKFTVSDNGIMQLGAAAMSITTYGAGVAATPLISPFGNNLATSATGKVHYKVTGVSPNRILTVEWLNVKNDNLSATADGTFQARLYETTGAIEFVYGAMAIGATGTATGYSIGISSSNTNTTYATLATATSTVTTNTATTTNTYTAGAAIADLNSSTNGSRISYTFTPTVPNAPTALNYTAISQVGMTLNWTDASNELGYVIYRSDDGGVTYNYITQLPANTVTSAQAGLVPGTTYFWKVYSVSEGGLSTALASSQITSAAGTKTSNIAAGNWSNAASWTPAGVPVATDNVIIANGHVITIDITTAVCNNLTVGGGTSGTLQFSSAVNSGLTVTNNVTVATGASFLSNATAFTKTLNIGGSATTSVSNGSLAVNGTGNFNMNLGATGTTTFWGSNNATISGTGTIKFYNLVINKGNSISSIIDATAPIIINAPSVASTHLTITSGTLKISSASTLTPFYGATTICAATGRLWLNNNAALVTCVGVGTTSAGAGAPTITGTLQIDAGTFGYGSGNNALTVSGTIILGGANAVLNHYGNVVFNTGSTLTMTAGNFNVDCQAGNALAIGIDVFNIGTSAYASVTGGTITITDPNPANAVIGFTEFKVGGTASYKNFLGSTIAFGNGVSSSAGNATNGGFSISIPAAVTLDNVVINNPSGTNRNVRISNTISATCNINNLTITSGLFNLNAFILGINGTLSNSGTIDASNAASNLIMQGSTLQSIGGVFTGTTIGKLTINNAANVTLASPLSVNATLTLTSGKLITTSTNLLTISNTATTAITGASTTSYISGPLCRLLPNNAAAATYTFPVGKSAYQLFELVSITTAGTGTASFTAEAFDANTGGTAGFGLTSINTDLYWKLQGTLGTVTLTSSTVRLTDLGMVAANAIGESNTLAGTYSYKAGTLVSNSMLTVKPVDWSNLATSTYFVIGSKGIAGGTYPVGTNYPSKLTDIATDLNTLTVYGNVILELSASYDGTVGETFPINFTNITNSGGPWNVTIRPAAGVSLRTTSGLPGSGSPLINLSGGSRIIFDGRAGGAGTSVGWLFRNTRTAATIGSTFRFINDATYDTLRYLQIEGQGTTNAVVLFSTTTGTLGNSYNGIYNCIIRDRTDVAGLPYMGIYSVGTALKTNKNNTIANNSIVNIFLASATSYGIYAAANSSDWTITGNSIYQTATRTSTAAQLSYGILANNTTGNNFIISNNYIGGTAPNCGGTPYTINGANANRVIGIYINVGTTTASSVQNNTISNFALTTSSTSGTGTGVWCGIDVVAGNVNIGTTTGNTIGSNLTNNVVSCTTTGSGSLLVGITSTSTGTVVINNNIIGGLNLTGAATMVTYVKGIQTSGTAGIYTMSNNLIGSNSLYGSLRAGTSGVTTAATYVFGIHNTATGAITIGNNTINGLVSFGTGASYTRGILNSGGATTINKNIIKNLISYGNYTATNANAAIIGISQFSTVAGLIVSENTISSLIDSVVTTNPAINVTGIYNQSATSGTNKIMMNVINSFTTLSTASLQQGINFLAGNANLENNMIRLGINHLGTSLTASVVITGIAQGGGNMNSYNNTSYIGGNAVVGGAINTYAFRKTGGTTDIIQNNIFVNTRSNTSGTAKHYAYVLNTATSITSDYNVLRASGTGGNVFSVNGGTTPFNTLLLVRTNFPNQDLHSSIGNPLLVNPDADASTFSLKISNGSPCEGTGSSIVGITQDFERDNRAASTPSDIGADAGSYTPMVSGTDIFTPFISYTNLPNDPSTSTRTLTGFATITDQGVGLNTTSGTRPRFYYKKSTDANAFVGNTSANNGWKWVEATGTTSPFTFIIDYSLIFGGGVATANTIQYFVIAQDNATTPNVWLSPFIGASATSVASITTAPTTPNSFQISPAIFGGGYNVGVGQTYTTLTGATGIFNAINLGTVNNNVTISIISDIIEPGTIALNQWVEVAGSGYTLTIQSDGTLRTLSGTAVAANTAMVRLNGADRVTFDGGLTQLLTFRNTNTTAANTGAVFQFDNSSTSISVNNINIESNGTTLTRGAITIGTVGINSGISITNNNIGDATGGTLGTYGIGIYSNSANNNVVTVQNNNIFNFTNTGIQFSTIGNGALIDNNNFYYNNATPASLAQTAISIQAGYGHTISNNDIGGQLPNCGGSAWVNTGNVAFNGINLLVGSASSTSIDNNNIQNINLTNSGANSFNGIIVNGGAVNIGFTTGNNIGQVISANSITIAGTGTVYPIIVNNTTAEITQNLIANITQSGTNPGNFIGIYLGGNNVINAYRNKIFNVGPTNTSTNTSIVDGFYLLNAVAGTNPYTISNNMITLGEGITNNNSYRGIDDNGNSGNIMNVYYNSILISGTSSGSTNTYAYLRRGASTISTTNNILYNNRIVNTGANYAIGNTYATPATGWLSSASNYNLLIAPSLTAIGEWGAGSANAFINWQSIASDINSWSDINSNVLYTNFFANVTNGDLSIQLSMPEAWYANGKGSPVVTAGITADFANTTGIRSTTIPTGATDIGAIEFTPTSDPPAPVITGTLAVGNTQVFSFAGRVLGTLSWTAGSDLPSDISFLYKSGTTPPDNLNGNYSNAYWSINPIDGSDFTYDVTLNYDPAIIGTIISESNIGISKNDTNHWKYYGGTVNTSLKTVNLTGQTSFCQFALTGSEAPLPIELLNFTATPDNDRVILKWETATELNNDLFTIERSSDGFNWETVTTKKGAGTSYQVLSYFTTDNNPYLGTSYYRLKQTDYNNKCAYSNVVAVNTNQDYGFSVFPNPFSDKVIISFSGVAPTSIRLVNAIGQSVTCEYGIQNNSTIVNTEHLDKGLYLLVIEINNSIQQFKLIKE